MIDVNKYFRWIGKDAIDVRLRYFDSHDRTVAFNRMGIR